MKFLFSAVVSEGRAFGSSFILLPSTLRYATATSRARADVRVSRGIADYARERKPWSVPGFLWWSCWFPLPREEFVYGKYETYQTSLKEIETLSGLSFGALTALDPLRIVDEAPPVPITAFEQIRFS